MPKLNVFTRCRGIAWPALVFLAILLNAGRTRAQDLSPAEKCIVDAAAQGTVADLSLSFTNEVDQVVGVAFLEDLLTSEKYPVARRGIRISNAIFTNRLDLELAEVPHDVWLNNCRFTQEVDLDKSHFQKDLHFGGSIFETNASFLSLSVDGDADFHGAIFADNAEFTWVDIKGGFLFDDAQFTNPDKLADFTAATVGHAATFNHAAFAGGVNFSTVNVAGQFIALSASFGGTNAAVNFANIKIGENAFFNNAVFAGGADFSAAQIAGQLVATSAQFTHPNKTANFNGLKVGQVLSLDNAMFAGGVDFTTADITGQFIAENTDFANAFQPVYFYGMKVGLGAFFDEAVFAGGADFGGAHFADNLHLDDGQFTRNADFSGMRVEGGAFFKGTTFNGPLSLKETRFATLDLTGMTATNALLLEGMTYDTIAAGNADETWETLKGYLARTEYRPDIYAGLEDFFRRQGDVKHANDVVFAQNHRERWETLKRQKILGWLSFAGDVLLEITVGYGLIPSLALFWIAGFILFGYFVFRGTNPDGTPVKMEPQNEHDIPREWNAFWYSFDLFAPVIDLQSANYWKPKPHIVFVRFYMRIHALVGWVLIPILLAAMTGIIK